MNVHLNRLPTIITAHTGAENTQENTLSGLQQLLDFGMEAVEVDVHLLNGTPVLSHDAPTPGRDYPLLADALKILQNTPHALMNLDLKLTGLVDTACQLASQAGCFDRILFTGSLDEQDQFYAKQAGALIWYNQGLFSDIEQADLPQLLGNHPELVINLHHLAVEQGLLDSYASQLSLWTVNDKRDLQRYLQAGVRGITTRQPLMALKLREQISGMV